MRKKIVNHIKNEIYFSLLDAISKISIEISRLKIECTCWIELIQEVAGSAVDLSHQLFRLICKSHQRQWLETNFCLSRYNQTVVFRSPFSKWRRGRLNLLRQVAIYYSRARRRNVFEDLIPSSCLATLFPSIRTNRDMQTVCTFACRDCNWVRRYTKELRYVLDGRRQVPFRTTDKIGQSTARMVVLFLFLLHEEICERQRWTSRRSPRWPNHLDN